MTVEITTQNPKIYHFLQTHQLGILATADKEGVPHAATIYFLVEPDFSIRFITKQQTTKHRNLQANPQAALAVYEAVSQITVQLSGPVEEVSDVDELEHIVGEVVEIAASSSEGHRPPISKLDAGKYVAYRLRPSSVRMAEFVRAEYPPVDEIFEVVTAPPDNL